MSSSLESEESSGQEQHVIVTELTSYGIDYEDVEKLLDADILTYNDLMKHKNKNSTGSKRLSVAKFNQICQIAEMLVKSTGNEGRSEEVDNNSEAAEKVRRIQRSLQLVAIDALISEGFSAGDVEMLRDAGIVTCNYLMYINKNLTEIVALSEAKDDEIGEAAETVKTKSLSMDKFYMICEAAQKLVEGLSEAKVDSNSEAAENVITVTYDNYKTIISNAAENAEKKILFGFAGEVKFSHLKAISVEIDKTNKYFAREDEFLLKDLVKVDEAIKGKKKEKMRDIILY